MSDVKFNIESGISAVKHCLFVLNDLTVFGDFVANYPTFDILEKHLPIEIDCCYSDDTPFKTPDNQNYVVTNGNGKSTVYQKYGMMHDVTRRALIHHGVVVAYLNLFYQGNKLIDTVAKCFDIDMLHFVHSNGNDIMPTSSVLNIKHYFSDRFDHSYSTLLQKRKNKLVTMTPSASEFIKLDVRYADPCRVRLLELFRQGWIIYTTDNKLPITGLLIDGTYWNHFMLHEAKDLNTKIPWVPYWQSELNELEVDKLEVENVDSKDSNSSVIVIGKQQYVVNFNKLC